MSIRDFFKKWSRERDQETVEFAEEGIAPPDEVEAMEERVAEHRHGDTTGTASPSDPTASA
jgi:hypothetical protein